MKKIKNKNKNIYFKITILFEKLPHFLFKNYLYVRGVFKSIINF